MSVFFSVLSALHMQINKVVAVFRHPTRRKKLLSRSGTTLFLKVAELNKVFKIAGICGVATPIVAYVCIFSAIAAWPQFSWVNNALSDLGVQQGITASLFNFGLVASGFLSLVFAVGLFRLGGKRLLSRVGEIGRAHV